jgi:superfamily I DNA/RNA helicase/mRNA-degrading endonuclease RelE of RelBE toxin-antitoxin system
MQSKGGLHMGSQWDTMTKPAFQTEWLTLPHKESHQVLEKLALLTQDPLPDGIVKQKLQDMGGRLHRIRASNYYIYYTFEKPYITLLAIRPRNDTSYQAGIAAAYLGGSVPDRRATTFLGQKEWRELLSTPSQEKIRLPEPISPALLNALHTPLEYRNRILSIQTREDLLDCQGVPDEILQQIDTYMFEKPLSEIVYQPDHILSGVEDLQRYKNGELLGFLLRLAPEQEKAANWALDSTGPTQVKGKPGTGKSTVALYRVHSILKKLRAAGQSNPHVLFTTYTNALVESSRQLLRQLLGADIACVEVSTADKLVVKLLGEIPRIAQESTLIWFIQNAVKQVLTDEKYRERFLKRLSFDYLLQEITQVIMARKITSIEQYIQIDRSGRRVGLTESERRTVWDIQQIFLECMKEKRFETWEQVRLRAEELVSKDTHLVPYDAVVVDEAQDLDPSVIRILVRLCISPNRFFITADVNQAIYRPRFTWREIDDSLQFKGRTTILKTNYRSTRQIVEAAHSYLTAITTETDEGEWGHVTNGEKPAVRLVENEADELQLLANYLTGAARAFHLGLRACAVFCPTNRCGQFIALKLSKLGVPATFMARQEVNLSLPGVKVLTIYASKGLEFPIVALAGFRESKFAHPLDDISDEEREEALMKNRRVIFVGMTRAMHSLLLLVPAETKSPLLTSFDPAYWDVKEPHLSPHLQLEAASRQ